MLLYGDLASFLATLDTAPATTSKLLAILANSRCLLEIELAAVVDAGESLVKATYVLGDSTLV